MFNNRRAVIVLCAVITVLLGFLAATRLTLNASFERMLSSSSDPQRLVHARAFVLTTARNVAHDHIRPHSRTPVDYNAESDEIAGDPSGMPASRR